MTRTRAIAFVSLVLVAAGVAAALAARLGESGRPALLPPEAVLLPPDAAFVMGMDVARFVASPLYQRIVKNVPTQPDVWRETVLRTGIDPERDVRLAIAAGDGRQDGAALAVLVGRFDRGKMERLLAVTPGVSKLEYKGRVLFVSKTKPTQKESAMSALSDHTIIAGPVSSVTAAIDRHKETSPGLPTNVSLMALVQQVRPGSPFWMCGDQSLLSAATSMAPGAGTWTLPSLRSIVLSGELEPDLGATIVGETADEPTAKGLVEMMQGLLALFAMQGSKKAEIAELAQAFEVTQEGPRIRVSARIRYDTLEKLQPRPRPRPTAITPP